MSIGWQASMESGAPLLDAQRRILVERADALVATIATNADRTSVERALRDFGDYSVRHFSQEEDCTLRGVCPALEWRPTSSRSSLGSARTTNAAAPARTWPNRSRVSSPTGWRAISPVRSRTSPASPPLARSGRRPRLPVGEQTAEPGIRPQR